MRVIAKQLAAVVIGPTKDGARRGAAGAAAGVERGNRLSGPWPKGGSAKLKIRSDQIASRPVGGRGARRRLCTEQHGLAPRLRRVGWFRLAVAQAALNGAARQQLARVAPYRCCIGDATIAAIDADVGEHAVVEIGQTEGVAAILHPVGELLQALADAAGQR